MATANSDSSTSTFSIAGIQLNTLISFVLLALPVIYLAQSRRNASLPDFPWVGQKENGGILKGFRTRWWCTMNYEEALKRAYDEYGSKSEPCILATLDGEVVLLPPSSMSWLLSQPNSVLSANEARKSNLQASYTFTHPEIATSSVLSDFVKSELIGDASEFLPEVCDELRDAIDEIWGVNLDPDDEDFDAGGWKTVVLHKSLKQIVARMSNRISVGLPLCCNEDYIKNAIGFADDVPFYATILRLFPGFIRAVIAPLALKSTHKHAANLLKIMTPEITRRKNLLQQKQRPTAKTEDSGLDEDEELGNDLLQWLLSRPGSHSKPADAKPEILAAHVLRANLASIALSSFTTTNALLDILASPRSERVLDTTRQEALDNMATDPSDPEDDQTGVLWSNESLRDKMDHLVSAIRESNRRASPVAVTSMRTVMAAETTPEGWRLPKGCTVATHVLGRTTSTGDADKYNAFRFLGKGTSDAEADEDSDSDFSSAMHFPVLILAYLLTRYEIQMVMEGGIGGNWNGKGARPECYWLGTLRMPPTSAKVKVRRRKEFLD